MDEMTLELNSPITEEQWDAITDVDFEHTERIWFHTKDGKDVEFIKRKAEKELIYCKDCKYYRTSDCYIHIERLWSLKPTDYCSQAENA